MIVKEGFVDHWKLKKLKQLTGREDAAEIVLRLWGSCQQRKNDRFKKPDPYEIAAICRYDGNPDQLVSWLVDCSFLDREGDVLIVHDWSEHNGTLISNWNNGKKGGRPSSSKTHGLADGLPHGETDRRIDRKKERKRKESGLVVGLDAAHPPPRPTDTEPPSQAESSLPPSGKRGHFTMEEWMEAGCPDSWQSPRRIV